MADPDFDDEMRRSLISAWHQFLGTLDPIRPALFRYCRQLTGSSWDAEDLVQETLLKAFAKLSHLLYSVKAPRAYVVRIATNLWMDRLRAQAVENAYVESQHCEAAMATASPSTTSEVRDAAAILMQRIAPQERAAFLLVEIFEMSLEETAEILGTSVGATKSALHRARAGLRDAEAPPARRRPRPSPELLDRFVERYNARDLPGLLALMRDDAAIESHGFHSEIGRDAFRRERGWFHHNFYNPMDGTASNARWQIAAYEGEPVILVFGGIADESTLTSVMRIEEQEGAVHRIFVYALCPDIVAAIGAHLSLPTQTFGYRFPFDVSRWP